MRSTSGRFRVLSAVDGEWVFVAVEAPDMDPYEPVYVPRTGHGDLDDRVGTLAPGYLVDATLEWEEQPRVTDLEVRKRSLFEFVDDAGEVFAAARETWAEAVETGDGMNSQVTYSTDGEANGVLYTFADRARDLFEEFRTGVRPIEPLVERVNENADEGTGDGGEGGDGDGTDDTRGTTDPAPATPGTGTGPGTADPSTTDDPDEPDVGIGPEGIRISAGDDPDEGENDREVFVIRPAAEEFVIVYVALRKGGVVADTMRDTYGLARPDEEK